MKFHLNTFSLQFQQLYKYCPQETEYKSKITFCLDSQGQSAVIALGIYFLESEYQHEKIIIPYLLKLLKALPNASFPENEIKPNKVDSKFIWILRKL